jgi:vacuolar-type H+-ATPase subunit F/Vma7
MSSGAAVVIVPPELASGFLLAGVRTVTAESRERAEAETVGLLDAAEEGVVAVYGPHLEAFDPQVRHRAERSLAPVVVPLPAGIGAGDEEIRRARLSAMLGRAVGYHITFGAETEREG